MTQTTESQPPGARSAISAWSPLKLPLFRALWLAALASNIGTWMHDVGAGWLMTSLSPTPVMVALVQTATALPIFLLAMPAGALADILDRRRFLLVTQLGMAVVAGTLGILTLSGVTTAWTLVALTFVLGIGSAMMAPAWAAVTPEIVPREELRPAVALNSMGVNVARAIGPAVAGLIISALGTGAVFVINALSFVGVVAVLYRWRRRANPTQLPAERFISALRTGARFARNAPALQAAAIRGCGFFVFASALWSLLPLVARQLVGGGPETFGILVASIGAGAVAGALLLPRVRELCSPDGLIAGATVLYAAATLTLAHLTQLPVLSLAMMVTGAAWLSVVSTLQVAAQMALPDWVRSRGLAVFMTAFMGSMTLGSLFWGKLADEVGMQTSLTIAAIAAVVVIALTKRWRITGIESADLRPSMHWPTPITHDSVTHDRGPVMVTIRYRVPAANAARFLERVRNLGRSRRRDGAFAWHILQDSEEAESYLESFMVESWLEHLRQHERVTDADRSLQEDIQSLLVPGSRPEVAHYISPARERTSQTDARAPGGAPGP